MSLTVKPVYRSRPFISAPYLYDVVAERWLVSVPIDNCSMKHLDPKASCHVVKGRQRHRKVGPSHLLWIYKCLATLRVQVKWQGDNGPTVPLKEQGLIEVLQSAEQAGDSTAPVAQGEGIDTRDPGVL